MKYYYYSVFRNTLKKHYPKLFSVYNIKYIIDNNYIKNIFEYKKETLLSEKQLNTIFKDKLFLSSLLKKMKYIKKKRIKNIFFTNYSDFKIKIKKRKKNKIISSIDCEFGRKKGKTFITEIGIVKYNLKTKKIEYRHFIFNQKKDSEKKLLCLIPSVIYKRKKDFKKAINSFLCDTDILVGHALHNDFKVLEENDIYYKKCNVFDIQSYHYKYSNNYISLKDIALKYSVCINKNYINKDVKNRIVKILKKKDIKRNIHKKNYNYGDIFLHNSFNDAFITLNVFKNMLKLHNDFNDNPLKSLDLNSFLEKQSKFYIQNINRFLNLNNG